MPQKNIQFDNSTIQGDPKAARLEFLKNELFAYGAKIARLEEQQAKNALALLIAGTAAGEIRKDLERLGASLPDWPDYKNLASLKAKIRWLMAKFSLSSAFALFGDPDLPCKLADSGALKNEVWFRYLAAIGVSSMGEILKAVREAEQIRHWLPRETRPYFAELQSFGPYFRSVIQCLDSLAEIPPEISQKIFRARGETMPKERGWTIPEIPGIGDWNFSHLARECDLLGDGIEREAAESKRRIEICLAVALALYPA